jgi:hypothetical protein
MLSMDSQGRRIIASEHVELLRADIAEARAASGPRRRLGGLLISAGLRLAPDAAPHLRRSAQR